MPAVRETQSLSIPLRFAVVSVCLAALVSYGAPQTEPTPCDNPTSVWTGTTGPMPPDPGVVTIRDLAVDGDGNVLVAGHYWHTADLDPTDALDEHTPVGSDDAFVTKVNADGSYAWTYTAGGGAGTPPEASPCTAPRTYSSLAASAGRSTLIRPTA